MVDEGEEKAALPSPRFTVDENGARIRKLHRPIKGYNSQMIDEIKLREPKYRDIMAFGDPSALIVMEGGVLPHDDMDLISRYISALSGLDGGLLEQVHYVDALALKAAVLDFFRSASAAT